MKRLLVGLVCLMLIVGLTVYFLSATTSASVTTANGEKCLNKGCPCAQECNGVNCQAKHCDMCCKGKKCHGNCTGTNCFEECCKQPCPDNCKCENSQDCKCQKDGCKKAGLK